MGVGISSSYFAIAGLGIYDSVARAVELGFRTVELGAAHRFEENVWETLGNIRRDFPETSFTVHGLFPPLEEKLWFNVALGLTEQNRQILENMFRAAEIVEALGVGVHPGFLCEAGWAKAKSGFGMPSLGKPIQREKAIAGLEQCFSFGLEKAEKQGVFFAVENIPNQPLKAPVFSKQEFEELFKKFPKLGLLLDAGHAMESKNLEGMLELAGRIREMHLHLFVEEPLGEGRLQGHQPFTEAKQLDFLKKVPQAKDIPLVFEHGNDVGEKEILAEKNLIENSLQ